MVIHTADPSSALTNPRTAPLPRYRLRREGRVKQRDHAGRERRLVRAVREVREQVPSDLLLEMRLVEEDAVRPPPAVAVDVLRERRRIGVVLPRAKFYKREINYSNR